MKQIFVVINLILLTAAAYLGVQILYKDTGDFYMNIHEQPSEGTGNIPGVALETDGATLDSRVSNITDRNVFKVRVTSSEPDRTPSEDTDKKKDGQEILPANLSLKLHGTVMGASGVFAVIEDTKKKSQSMYQTGEVIQGAVLKEISTHQVVLTFEGKDQVLELKIEPLPLRKSGREGAGSGPAPPEQE